MMRKLGIVLLPWFATHILSDQLWQIAFPRCARGSVQ
jgi:hypothetical protein